MSQAHLIDARRFSRENRVLEGVLPVSDLQRLADLLAAEAGENGMVWQLSGETGERGEPRLRLRIDGNLPLRCQRCLATMREPVAIDRCLELVAEDAAVTQEELEDEQMDVLPVGKILDVAALVEEEILLALPLVPRHAACALPQDMSCADTPHPFAGLAELVGKHP
ncbi:MAG: YceD family protein [Zoogloeaceae bacterium]|jgi:uncharacterized protein|nr:YceD family protein [Zoogloeaceae bacterium]